MQSCPTDRAGALQQSKEPYLFKYGSFLFEKSAFPQ